MLVLSRHTGEGIQIGENVRLVVLSVGPDKIRLGIDAPADVEILRGELVERPATAPENTEA